MKKAVFPGSFDPITLGHVDLVLRSLALFDEIVIAIGTNAAKTSLFSLAERIGFIEKTFGGQPKIKVDTYEGLTADYCKKTGAGFILRGLRNTADFEYEKTIAQANAKLTGIETAFLFSAPEHAFISSSIVRDVIRNGGDCSLFVPSAVIGK
jgi:pantetheine-phosphate adenylyltransferase